MDKIGFFDLNIDIVKCAGLWVPDQGEGLAIRRRYLVYNVIVIGFTVLFCDPMELLALRFSYHHFEELMKNVSIGGTHTLAVGKVVVWLYNRKELLRIMRVLESKAAEYKAIVDFDPVSLVLEEKKLKDVVTRMFLFMGAGVSVSAYTGAMWTFLTEYKKFEQVAVDSSNETTYRYTQKLPYYMQMPFAYDTSKLRYAFALIFNCIPAYHYAWIIVGMTSLRALLLIEITVLGIDTAFISIFSYISVSLRILQGAFRTIRPRCLVKLKMDTRNVLRDSVDLSSEMIKEMNRCVAYLQLLFK